jgi:pimeloyl-ACP methyl ester carboxylesterase
MGRFVKSLGITVLAVAAAGATWLVFAPSERVARVLVAIERNRAGLVAKLLDLPDLAIAYLEGGRGEPLIVLHGIGADKDNWTRVAPHLTGYFRVIAPDLPGFGDSERRPERTFTAEAQVENVRRFARALGLDSFHLGGNSMGGMIAAIYAATYPGEVRSLWLLAPAGVGAGPVAELAGVAPGGHVPLFARSIEELNIVIGWVMSSPPYVPTPVKRSLAARAAADYELHVRIFHELNAEWRARPLEQTMAGSPVPTRIVWGEADRVLPVSGAAVLAEAMPHASALVLPGVGHIPMFESASVVGEDYVAFVQSNVRTRD